MIDNRSNAWVPLIFLVVSLGLLFLFVHYTRKQEEKVIYEIAVVDKYETLGSSFHLIGGRATEMEYHIIYESRLIDDNNGYARDKGCRCDRKVSPDRYRRTAVGSKIRTNKPKWY